MLQVSRQAIQILIYIIFQSLVHSSNNIQIENNYESLYFIIIIKEEFLVSSEFQNSNITPGDVSGWSYNTIRTCERDLIVEYSGEIYGIFEKDVNLNKKTYSSLLPHWSALVRFDLMLYGSVDIGEGDVVQILIDNIYYNDNYSKFDREGYTICSNSKPIFGDYYNDQVYPYQRNVTHVGNSLTLSFSSKFFGSSYGSDEEGYAFKHLSIYIDTCYEVCSECSGPTAAQCTKCIAGATVVNSVCKCSGTKVAHNFQCIDSCPIGYNANIDTGICELSKCQGTCTNCQNNICTSCVSKQKLLQGECVSSCPTYSVDKVTYCEDKITGLAYGGYIFKGLYSKTFGDSGIQGEGITTAKFKNSTTTFSSCNGERVIGGWNLAGSEAEIIRDLPLMQYILVLKRNQNNAKQINRKTHWSIRIGFKYHMIDDWSDTDSIQVILDKTNIKSTITKSQGQQNIVKCGIKDKPETTGFYDLNMTHTGSSLRISIKGVIGGSKNEFQASFGIRELYVLIDYCQPNCDACDAKGCTKCPSGTFLYKLNCGTDCPTGYWKNTVQNTCDLCVGNCDTCDKSATSCLTCKPGTYLSSKSCGSSCPGGTAPNTATLTCDDCFAGCSTCTKPGDGKNCTGCAIGFYLFQNECLTNCPQSTYKTGQKCAACEPTCLNCKGATAKDCSSCGGQNYLRQSECVKECGASLYEDNTNNTCSLCDQTCDECSGPNKDQCTKCKGQNFLQGTNCVTTCDQGSYKGSNNLCMKCEQSCTTCDGSANNCLTCTFPNYFKLNKCVSDCDPNQFKDNSSSSCKNCDPNCKTCNGPGDKKCTGCNGSSLLHIDGSCVPQCPTGYYSDINVCKKCPAQCTDCIQQGGTPTCSSCPPDQSLYNGQCEAVCPPKTYKSNNGTTNVCLGCDVSCQTCSGPSNTECKTCLLPNYFYSDTFECKTTCKPKFYPSNSNATCLPCNPSCLQCSGDSANECTGCSGNYLQNKTCTSTCTKGTFPNSKNNICEGCNSSCATCSGPSDTECVTCENTSYLQTDKKSCLSSCKSNEFQNTTNNQCTNCNPACLTCSGSGSDQCQSCKAGFYLHTVGLQKKCVTDCGSGYYINGTECSKCSDQCLTCTSPGDNASCLTCDPPNLLFEGKCIPSCPIKTYESTTPATKVCSKCFQDCLTCTGPQNTECKSCALPLYFVAATSECKSTCEPKFFKNEAKVECSACFDKCATCNGPSSNQCQSCPGGTYLDGNSCVIQCSQSKFVNTANNTCTQCDVTCKTCQGTADNCLTCSLPSYFQSSTKKCVTACKPNEYKDDSNVQCKSCNNSCQTCTGPSSDQCSTCNGTDVLVNGKSCKGDCPEGTFKDGPLCKTCASTCKTCIYPGDASKCITCQPDKYLYKGECLSQCIAKTFPSQCIFFQNYYKVPDNSKICEDCDQTCTNCQGALNNQCTACSLPNYLNPDNTCKATCGPTLYKNDSIATCSQCHTDCLYCSGPNSNQCTGCSGTKFLENNQCVNTCPQKKYPNTIDNTCSQCHQSCKSCNGALATNCNSCDSPNFKQTGSEECKTTCNLNEYRDSSTYTCKPCHSSCKTCNDYGADKCLSCNGTELLHLGNTCTPNCPPGYYKDVNVCKKCSADCKTCDYPGDNSTCLTCPSDKYLFNNQCLVACPDKQYPSTVSGNNTCQSCHSTCLTCKGPSSTECTKCNSSFYYNPNSKECSSSCDDKYYKNDSLSTCSPCDTLCQTCNGPNTNSCLSCSGTKFFDGTNCIDDCPNGKFKNLTNNTCTVCHPTCKTCKGTAATECESCATPYYLQTQSLECKTTCNINEFKDTSTQKCVQCHKKCKTCNGTGENKCISCNAPDLLIDGKSCDSSCPESYYSDSIACKPCDLSCKRCRSPGDNMSCSGCQSDKFLSNGQCVSQCPNKFFSVKNNDTNVCTQCDPSCDTCSGLNSNQCLTCKLPNYLNELTHECKASCDQRYYQNDKFAICSKCSDSCFECTGSATNQCKSCSGTKYLDGVNCVDKCPPGKFERTSDNICAPCHSSCKTCNGTSSTNCLSCVPPLYFQPMTNECSDQCYSSQFKNDTTFSCLNCNSSCKTCKGSESNQCLSCQGNNLLHVDNTCVVSCTDGFYQDGYTCKQCSAECSTCSAPGNNKSCLTCASDKFIYQGQCLTKCPSQTFIKIIQGVKVCAVCDSSCLTCTNSAKNQCLSCSLPNYFSPQTNECNSTCDDGYYKNDQKITCSPCDKSCKNCNGPAVNQCTGCAYGKFLESQKCVTDCPAGKYKNPSNNTCSECSSNCKSCIASNPNICASCSLPYYFQSRDLSCQLNCQSDQYRDDASVSCISCHSTCETCLGSKDNDCLTCTGSTYLENKKCVDICSTGSYGNKTKHRCEKCNRNCKTCFGPDSENCLSCQLPLYYQKSGNKCVTQCEKTQYTNDQNAICEDCHQSCASCKGGLINQCLSCSGSFNLYENTCIDKCPDKFYPEQNVCKNCADGCQVCSSGSLNKCQVCENNYFIHQGKCLKKCPEFFFEDDYSNRCEPCSSNCSQCVNSGSLTCLKCGNNSFLYNNDCIPKCPIGTYIQDKGCFNCDISCVTCSGPQDTKCLSCQPNMFLQGSQCVAQCDTGYAQLINNQVCAKCDSSCETCSGSGSSECLTCQQDTIPFGTSCLRTCPDNFFKVTGELKCSNCKPNCSKCTNNTDCHACSKGYVMFNGECISSCPKQEYFIDEKTNSCILCDKNCKDSGCYGPSENECIMNYIEAKESILFIIFMTKLGYWFFSCITGYFMDKFDDGEYQKKVTFFMNTSSSPTKIKNVTEQNFTRNQTMNDLNNNGINQSQTLQNISLNMSYSHRNQALNPKASQMQFNNSIQTSPTKNHNTQYSWRQQNQTDKNNYNQQNISSHRPIIKRFSFKQEEEIATFREQDNNQKDGSQIDNNNNNNQQNNVESPIDLPYDQKLYYILIGNDLISTWTLYNPDLSRIFRATLVYFKFLCFFYATEQIYKKNPGLLILCIFVGMIIKEAVFIFLIQFAICLRKSAAFAVSLLSVGIIVLITVWFKTEIQRLSTHKDITWSWMYLTVFLVDFILVQSLIALLRYMSSIRYLEKKRDKTQAVLNKTFVDKGMILKIKEKQQEEEQQSQLQ